MPNHRSIEKVAVDPEKSPSKRKRLSAAHLYGHKPSYGMTYLVSGLFFQTVPEDAVMSINATLFESEVLTIAPAE